MKTLLLATRHTLVCLLVCALAWPPTSMAQPATRQATPPIRIRITDGTWVLTATLEGSPAAADFASMLPLALTLEDYAATEKIAYLPRKLAVAGTPTGADPAVADIAYFVPWGNLAIYYRDAGYDNGLVRLGRLDNGVGSLQQKGPVKVRIERIEN